MKLTMLMMKLLLIVCWISLTVGISIGQGNGGGVGSVIRYRMDSGDIRFGSGTILFPDWSIAGQRCIYGPMTIMMPDHPDWGSIKLSRGTKNNPPGSICVASKSPIHPVLLPTGTFMIINDEGYAWVIAIFKPHIYAGVDGLGWGSQ